MMKRPTDGTALMTGGKLGRAAGASHQRMGRGSQHCFVSPLLASGSENSHMVIRSSYLSKSNLYNLNKRWMDMEYC